VTTSSHRSLIAMILPGIFFIYFVIFHA